jgi:hypothetical protein
MLIGWKKQQTSAEQDGGSVGLPNKESTVFSVAKVSYSSPNMLKLLYEYQLLTIIATLVSPCEIWMTNEQSFWHQSSKISKVELVR